MNIVLPTDIAKYVDGLVAAGQFESTNDAVVAGVRLLMGRQQLQADIQQGIDELDAGQGIDGEIVFAELRERANKLAGPSE